MSAKSKSNEIQITRLYNAPVQAVWDAWTDPQQVAQWWGPRGFTITHHGKDLSPGGFWKYTMHGPDGVDYENKTIYLEVDPLKRLVYDHGGNDDRPPLFRVTVLFSQVRDQTKMEMTMALPTPEAAADAKKFIKKAGGNGTWDRLAEYLEKKKSGSEKFVINRTFDVPLNVMFKMWTDPKHFGQWCPPTGFRMEFIRAEIKEGGKTFYFMTNDAGVKMYGRTQYMEVSNPHRLVYTQEFCDENEKLSRHPGAPVWPATFLTTVTFAEEEGGSKTRVTLTWEPFAQVTAAEIAAFVKERGGMTQGWTGSFDKLENYLTQQ